MFACIPNPQAIPEPVTWVAAVVVVPPGGGDSADALTPTADDMGGTAD